MLALAASTTASAQTCAAYDPVRNGNFSHTGGTGSAIAEWVGEGVQNGDNWEASGTGTNVRYLHDDLGQTVSTISQTIYGVSPSSQLNLRLSWGNGVVLGSPPNGNQLQLQVVYAGVVYATFLTSPYVAGSTVPSPGPTAGASYTANNGATISADNPNNWTTTPGISALYTVTLPAGVPLSGDLVFQVVRTGPAIAPTTASDDIYLNTASVDTSSVCLQKTSVGGTGTFNFTTTGLDSDLIATGSQSTASITTTTAGTPLAYDAAASVYAGIQPMVRTTTGGFTITETNPLTSGYSITNVTCSSGTVSLTSPTSTGTRTLTVSGLAARQDTTCTFTNTQQTDLQVVKTASPNPVLSGNVITYSLVVTNNGPSAATNVVLSDTPTAGQNCSIPSTTATCSATGGASCPSPTVPVSTLLGSGITIPTLPVGGQVTVTLQCTVTASGL